MINIKINGVYYVMLVDENYLNEMNTGMGTNYQLNKLYKVEGDNIVECTSNPLVGVTFENIHSQSYLDKVIAAVNEQF